MVGASGQPEVGYTFQLEYLGMIPRIAGLIGPDKPVGPKRSLTNTGVNKTHTSLLVPSWAQL